MSFFRCYGGRCRSLIASLLLLGGCTGVIDGTRAGRQPEGNGGAGSSGAAGEEPRRQLSELFDAMPAEAARLTIAEYTNTLTDLFGASVVGDVALEADYAFENSVAIGAHKVAVSRSGVRSYAEAAERIAKRAVEDAEWRSRFAPCAPAAAVDAPCAQSVVASLGRDLFRRPLESDELTRFAALAVNAAREAGDFFIGIQYSLSALLLSPKFTHRIELGRERGSELVPSDYELASRMSYLLWDTVPDDELFAAAERGTLSRDEEFDRQLERLLSDPRIHRGVQALFDDVFVLQKIEHVSKDVTRFPMDGPLLRASMRTATQKMIDDVLLLQQRRVLDLYESNVLYADARLGSVLGLDVQSPEFERFESPASSPRVGILTEPTLLAANAGAMLTSPTFRGKYVREHLLCQKIAAPPADANNSLPANAEGKTRREQLENHREMEPCKSCHEAMDPIGMGFETFDAIGRVQETDNGYPIDATGQLDGVSFDGPRELSRALSNHPRAETCLIRRITEHALGSHVSNERQQDIEVLLENSREHGSAIVPLLRFIVRARGFRTISRAY
jgi:hypothetical protein